jgi:serine/threonine protein kinase
MAKNSHQSFVAEKRDKLNLEIIRTSSGDFIPNERIGEILKYDVIYKLIAEPDYNGRCPAKQVCKSIEEKGQRSFAILLLTDNYDLAPDLYLAGFFNDFKLPRPLSDIEGLVRNAEKSELIHKKQFTVAAPILDEGSSVYFEKYTVMPSLDDERVAFQGQNSVVSQVTIPLSHLKPITGQDTLNIKTSAKHGLHEKTGKTPISRVTVARKEVVNGEGSWTEINNHQKLLHRSLLPLFAVYKLNDKPKLNLLLPFYSKNLAMFLREDDTWMDQIYWDAMYDLMDAVRMFHNLPNEKDQNIRQTGAHGDIKPANILVDVRKKRFILADFGSLKFQDLADGSKIRNPCPDGDYLAPECRSDPTDQHSSSKGDIWSLGCIFMELVLHMDSPSSETIPRFRKKREVRADNGYFFASTYHNFGDTHNAVTGGLKELGERFSTTAWKNIIKVICRMLQIDSKYRPTAKEVCEELNVIREGVGRAVGKTGDGGSRASNRQTRQEPEARTMETSLVQKAGQRKCYPT